MEKKIMIKFSDILPLLNMAAYVYIYANGDNSYLIFDGVLSALPLEGYLHVKDLYVKKMYSSVHEWNKGEPFTTLMNIIVEGRR